MQRFARSSLVLGLFGTVLGVEPIFADPLSLQGSRYGGHEITRNTPAYIGPAAAERPSPARYAATEPRHLGGGFIEFLFGGGRPGTLRPPEMMGYRDTYSQPEPAAAVSKPAPDPRYDRQVMPYHGTEKPGTIVIDTPNRFLYLVQDNGTAVRYGIGVGRPGFTWAGVKTVSAKKEWPDWTPPPEMLQRRPDLPNWMAGGPENPLGARALYLGSSLYRIHGSNEPWTIGQAVSSGCIRMRNEDVVDLYERVRVGTKVVVI